MADSILVSIIVPVYNCEKYIGRCIESLINQTYNKIEIILIDDGSIDKSLNIIKQYSEKDDRIIIINQENSGPSVARNRGIARFVDADDYVNCNYIKKMINNIYNKQADLVISDYIEIRKNGKQNVEIFKFISSEEKYKFDETCICEVLCGTGGIVWAKLFNTNIIKKNNINFNKDIYMCEDLLFCLEFIKHTSIITHIKEALYYHNSYNVNSITAKYNKNLFNEQINVQKIIESFLIKYKLMTKQTESFLYQRLKSILWFAIYKEISMHQDISCKLNNIKNIITNVEIIRNIDKFEKNGPIDKYILKYIKKQNNIMVYILGKTRIFIADLRFKIDNIHRI